MKKKLKISILSTLILGTIFSMSLPIISCSNSVDKNDPSGEIAKKTISKMSFINTSKENELKNILIGADTPNDMIELTKNLNWNEYLLIEDVNGNKVSDNVLISIDLIPTIIEHNNSLKVFARLNAQYDPSYFVSNNSNILDINLDYFNSVVKNIYLIKNSNLKLYSNMASNSVVDEASFNLWSKKPETQNFLKSLFIANDDEGLITNAIKSVVIKLNSVPNNSRVNNQQDFLLEPILNNNLISDYGVSLNQVITPKSINISIEKNNLFETSIKKALNDSLIGDQLNWKKIYDKWNSLDSLPQNVIDLIKSNLVIKQGNQNIDFNTAVKNIEITNGIFPSEVGPIPGLTIKLILNDGYITTNALTYPTGNLKEITNINIKVEKVEGLEGYHNWISEFSKGIKKSILDATTYIGKKEIYDNITSKSEEISNALKTKLIFSDGYTWDKSFDNLTITKGTFPLETIESGKIPPIIIKVNLKNALKAIQGNELLTITLDDLGYWGKIEINKLIINENSLINRVNDSISRYKRPIKNTPSEIEKWLNHSDQSSMVKGLFAFDPWDLPPEVIANVITKVDYDLVNGSSDKDYKFSFTVTLENGYKFNSSVKNTITLNNITINPKVGGPWAITKLPVFLVDEFSKEINIAFKQDNPKDDKIMEWVGDYIRLNNSGSIYSKFYFPNFDSQIPNPSDPDGPPIFNPNDTSRYDVIYSVYTYTSNLFVTPNIIDFNFKINLQDNFYVGNGIKSINLPTFTITLSR